MLKNSSYGSLRTPMARRFFCELGTDSPSALDTTLLETLESSRSRPKALPPLQCSHTFTFVKPPVLYEF